MQIQITVPTIGKYASSRVSAVEGGHAGEVLR
jgi:hypothetical protein